MFERGHVWVKFSQFLLVGHWHQKKALSEIWTDVSSSFMFHFNIEQHRNWLAADLPNKQHLILWVLKLEFYFCSGSYALGRWCCLDGMLIVCFPNVHSGEQLWILFIDLLNKLRGRSLISLMIVLLKSLCKELPVDFNDRGCSQIMASPASSYPISPWSLIFFFWGLHFFCLDKSRYAH